MMSSGTTFMHDAAVARQAVEVIAEGAQHEAVVDGIAHELVRPGADRVLAQLASGAGRDDLERRD